jgi:hypothetical protein
MSLNSFSLRNISFVKIYDGDIIYGPPLWPSSQSSWLQMQGSRVRFPGTTKKKKVVGLKRGALSLVSTTEELLDRKVAPPV